MQTEEVIISGTTTAKLLYSFFISWIASILAYLNIDSEMIMIYFLLLFIDLLVGTASSFINKIPLTKARLTAGLLSKLLMFIIPITVALLVKMQGSEVMWVTKWTLVVLATSEAISIFSNILTAQGKEPLPKFDAVGIIATKLRDILEKLFKVGGA